MIGAYQDIVTVTAIVLLFSVGCGIGGSYLGKRITSPVFTRLLLFASILLLLAYSFLGADRLLWASCFPVSGIVIAGNAILPGVAFVIGLLSTGQLPEVPFRRRIPVMVVLLVGGIVQALRPLVGAVPPTLDVVSRHWPHNVCPQTTPATCSAASAATLLSTAHIPASEGEMAQLCFTRAEGTLMLGTYRGLVRKTAGTPYTVHPLLISRVSELKEAAKRGPMLISAGLDQWQQGRIDPRYETRWGWEPGMRHAIVLFGFLPDHKVDIGDPSTRRETWDENALNVLWHGEALQIVPRNSPP